MRPNAATSSDTSTCPSLVHRPVVASSTFAADSRCAGSASAGTCSAVASSAASGSAITASCASRMPAATAASTSSDTSVPTVTRLGPTRRGDAGSEIGIEITGSPCACSCTSSLLRNPMMKSTCRAARAESCV